MPNSEPIPLKPAQRGRAGALLARAFRHDLVYKGVIRDEAKRTQLLARRFDKVVRCALLCGHVHTPFALEGVACRLPLGRTHVTLARLVPRGLCATVAAGWAAKRRFDSYAGCSGGLHSFHAPAPHWYVSAWG
jgi:hypothetical protein